MLLCAAVVLRSDCLAREEGHSNHDPSTKRRRLSASTVTLPSLATNPFLSDSCQDSFEDVVFGKGLPTGVVIPVRNEDKGVLLHTVQSILRNSDIGVLKEIVVVDDMSDVPIKDWPEWAALGKKEEVSIRVVTPNTRVGVAGAKDFGARLIKDNVETLVFVDAHVVVSEHWLLPLTHVIESYPKSLVYPAIDVIDPESGSFARGENVVGGFTWGLGFRWESPKDSSRLPGSITGKSEDDVVTSPAAPGILAVKTSYYVELGGFDVTLYPWGQENIELSIRAWLCGGIVVRQPCSRVAHRYDLSPPYLSLSLLLLRSLVHPSFPFSSLFPSLCLRRYDNLFRKTSASAGNGVTQASVDLNVMSVAEHWMKPAYRELVHAARFTGRIPYTVQLDLDAKQPLRFNLQSKPLGEANCATFDWYLKEVYPGLLVDMPVVEERFRVHIESNFAQRLLEPWTKMYLASGDHPAALDATTEAAITARTSAVSEVETEKAHNALIPRAVYNPLKDGTKRGLAKRIEIRLDLSDEKDPHERHANYVRATLKCEDEKDVPHSQPCDKLAASTNSCVSNRYYMMFGCPKSCGLCGTDGKICFDFFEHKCPEYKKEGRCELEDEAEQMKHDCRLSCGHCTPAGKADPGAIGAAGGAAAAAVAGGGEGVVSLSPPKIEQQYPIVEGVNHRLAQEQYAKGLLPDTPGSNPCALNGLPHGKLLARVPVAAPVTAPDVRVFCALYTMEKNHATNVKAVRDTWGKRCDGFLAFSTVTDPDLPALRIEHEGDEAYDNMWQKSRSIWKFVAKNYASQFDYFLIGGDDMYYVVENLKAYLNSPEIRALRDKGKGVFLGRRFFPPKQRVFNSGGAGYTLDRVALGLLASRIDTPECYPHQRGFWEDVNIANCLNVAGEILPYDTRDSLERERFHPFSPGQHLDYRKPVGESDWYPKYNPFLKEGYDCCSSESISFHYCPADLVRSLHVYQYHCVAKRLD